MCISPIKIRNPSKHVSFNLGSPFYYYVPCGRCAECLKNKQDSYLARLFAESIKFQDGYLYFETLTYNDVNLPHFEGMSCFSQSDLSLFIKRLRQRIKYYLHCQYNDLTGNFKYFIVKEYGGLKHRPHYHAIFFVRLPIHVFTLRNIINESWQKGFIDRIYTVNNRVYTGGVGVFHYVSKYVTKTVTYQHKLDSLFYDLENSNKYDAISLKKAKRNMQEGVYLSNGIGDNLLSIQDSLPFYSYQEFLNTGLISIPDYKNKRKLIKLPLYNLRKFLYEKVNKSYRISEFGINYKINILNTLIQKLSNHYESIIINPTFIHTSTVRKLLKNCSFTDLAIYNIVYRNTGVDTNLISNYDYQSYYALRYYSCVHQRKYFQYYREYDTNNLYKFEELYNKYNVNNKFLQFRKFEIILQLFENYTSSFMRGKTKAFIEKFHSKQLQSNKTNRIENV